jgi:hypothetical protein
MLILLFAATSCSRVSKENLPDGQPQDAQDGSAQGDLHQDAPWRDALDGPVQDHGTSETTTRDSLPMDVILCNQTNCPTGCCHPTVGCLMPANQNELVCGRNAEPCQSCDELFKADPCVEKTLCTVGVCEIVQTQDLRSCSSPNISKGRCPKIPKTGDPCCGGCIDSSGECKPGTENTACGNSGNTCVSCLTLPKSFCNPGGSCF